MRSTRPWSGAHAVALVLAILVAACSATSDAPASVGPAASGGLATAAAGARSVTVEGGTGELGECLKQAFWDPFTAETGIEVIAGPVINDDSRIRTMVETGVFDVDVEWTFSATVLPPNGPALFEPIDYTKVARDEIVPGLAQEHGVGGDILALVLGYRTDEVGASPPTSWADFFDVATYPGKRGLYDGYYAFMWALLADGVPIDQLIPLDLERAKRKLDSIKDELVFWQTGTQVLDLLASGEVAMADVTANRITTAREQGSPVEIAWNAGFLMIADFLAVIKGNPNTDVAMDLIAFTMRKDINGRQSACVPLAPGNQQATVDDAAAPDLATSHLDADHLLLDEPAVAKYLAENLDVLNDAWLEWKGS